MKLCGDMKCTIKYEEICIHSVVDLFIKSNPAIITFLWNISQETIKKCPARFRPFPTYFIKNKKREHYKRGDIDDIVSVKIEDSDVERVKKIFEVTDIKYIIEFFVNIPLANDLSVLQLLTEINPEIYYLLRFLILSNKTTMISDLYEFDDGSKHNITLYKIVYDDETERKFEGDITYLYHGSAKGNWHSILRNGIKNCSKTSLLSHGAAYGSGIYLSDSLAFSATYTQGGIMAIIELQGSKDKWRKSTNIFVIDDESIILVRYLLEIPTNPRFPVRKLEKLIDSKLSTYLTQRVSSDTSLKKQRQSKIMSELKTFINLHHHVHLTKADIKLTFKDDTLSISLNMLLTPTQGEIKEKIVVIMIMHLPRKYPFAPPVIYLKYPILSHKFITSTGLIYDDKLFGRTWQPTIKLEPLITNIVNDIISQSEIVLKNTYEACAAQKEHDLITRNIYM